jgi:hypothetical protein
MRREGTGAILVIAFWGAFLVGWVMNIYKFSQYDFDTPLKAEVIRGIGIVVAPMGAVIGYIDIKDK